MKQDQDKIVLLLAVILVVLVVSIILVSILTNQREEMHFGEEESSETAGTEEKPSEAQTIVVEPEPEVTDDDFAQALAILLADDSGKYTDAFSSILKAADHENLDAQYFAGEMYLKGIGTAVDFEKAAEYIGKAFENGNEHAFSIYGKMSFMGDGLRQDYEQAYYAFQSLKEPAAEVYCAMGIMNVYGMGTRTDYEKARTYLDAAAAMGDTTAQTVKASIKGAVYERRPSEAENALVPKSITTVDYAAVSKELMEQVALVYERMEEQEEYKKFDEELMQMSKMSPGLVSQVAIFGKDNWLFFQSAIDGDSYHDYVGDNAFTETDLLSIKNNLEVQKKKAEEAGAQFVLLVYPNKEIIYEERMPSYIVRDSDVTRTDELVSYLQNHSDIEVIYPKEQMQDLKDTYQLYYSTDTHCNMLGCFVGLSELLHRKYEKQPVLDADNFEIHSKTYTGDIGVMIGREDRYAADTVYFLPAYKVPDEDKVDASMILVGDSFSDFLRMESEHYFQKGVNHFMVMDYEYDFEKTFDAALSAGSADIIVWECAERNIERLK